MTEAAIRPALVATLGLQPQVITRALDHFLFEGIEPDIEQVSIIHTAAFRPRHPYWPSLDHFVAYLKETYPTIRPNFVPITDPASGRTVSDVETPEYAEQTYTILFNEIKRLKQEGRRLHGFLAGGRKSMIVYMMVSAQILFDETDQLWHLFSRKETEAPHVLPEMRRRIGLPVPSKDASHLIEIPILHLAGLMPMVHELIVHSNDPTRAMHLYRKHETVEEIARLHRFYQYECDEIDREILRLAISVGLSNLQIGEKVHLSEATVSNRITKIARRFYTPAYGGVLPEWPKHVSRPLYPALAPLIMYLEQDK